VRYLARNLPGLVPAALRNEVSCPANACASPDAQRLIDAQKAVSAFLDGLPKHASLPPERILLIVDSIQPEVYTDENAGKDSYFGQMRERLLEEAQNRGYETIDISIPCSQRTIAKTGSFSTSLTRGDIGIVQDTPLSPMR